MHTTSIAQLASELPVYQRKSQALESVLHFLEEKYGLIAERYKEIYNDQHLATKLAELERQRDGQLEVFERRLRFLLQSLTDALEKGGHDSVAISVPVYGPDVQYSADEREMHEKALLYFHNLLGQKQYPFLTVMEETRGCDFMEGHCRIGKMVITVTLQ